MRMSNAFSIALWLTFSSTLLLVAVNGKPENIVLFFTDDQDMSTMAYIPKTRSIFDPSPIKFLSTFTTTPVCCPSRSTLVSGKYLHNNGAVNNSIEGNCSSNAWQQRNEPNTFPVWLQQAGYNTFYAGKYLNAYGDPNTGGPRVPMGWTDWHGSGSSEQYGFSMSNNGVETFHGNKYPDDYMPLLVENYALDFLGKQTANQSFAMVLSFTACHMPDDAEPKYQSDYVNMTSPRQPSFNASVQGKEWIVSSQPPMDANKASYTDVLYRRRLQILRTVDDTVASIVDKLKQIGVLESTHLFYASDNGFHLGQFRMIHDKRLPYEFDVRVPIMWKPAATRNVQPKTVLQPVAVIDLAPTFLDIAGFNVASSNYDGQSMLSLLNPGTPWRTALLLEYRGEGDILWSPKPSRKPDAGTCFQKNLCCTNISSNIFSNPPRWNGTSFCYCQDAYNNSYNCLRILSEQYNQLYCEFLVNTQPCEFYDMAEDPYQLNNICSKLSPDVQKSLTNELNRLAHCSGSNCISSHFKPRTIFHGPRLQGATL